MNSNPVHPELYKVSSLSPDDYQQIMMSSIGSVRPSRNSIVGFLTNPQDLFTVGNLQTIFDDDDDDDDDDLSVDDDLPTSCPSIPTKTYFPRKALSSNTKERTEFLKALPARSVSNEVISDNTIDQSIHDNDPADYVASSELSILSNFSLVSTSSSSSTSLSSKSGAFLVPDSYAEPVDEGLFSDLSEDSKEHSSNSIKYQTMKTASPSLLHQACYLYPKTLAVVNSALLLEKSNLRKRIATPEQNAIAPFRSKRVKRDPSLTLPLHIALQHNGSLEVIQCLALGAPDVIAMRDGPNECNAVSGLLYQKRFDFKILSFLVQQCPKAIRVVDRYQNTSLHVACAQGAPLEVVEILYTAFPKAISQTNILGLKPLHVAQQMNLCSVDVIDFLQDLILNSLEEEACELMDLDC